jgi:hypothetical protein
MVASDPQWPHQPSAGALISIKTKVVMLAM